MFEERTLGEPALAHHASVLHTRSLPPLAPADRRRGLSQELLTAVLDEVGNGLMLLDTQARVCWANRMARRTLLRSSTLAVVRDELVAGSAADTRALQRALATARQGRRAMVRLGGKHGATMVACVPVPSGDAETPTHVLLVMGRREPCEPLAVQFFASAYELTGAEAGVLDALSRGCTPAQVAAAGRVSVSTVRTQIATARLKTGASSIAHLLRMVASLPPVVTTVDNCAAPN